MMKNRHFFNVISVACLLLLHSMAWGESIELGYPLPGRVKFVATAAGISKRIQISGSLRPLRVFINGKERTQDLTSAECSKSGVAFNEAEIVTQGTPGIFYWEGEQAREELSLKINE